MHSRSLEPATHICLRCQWRLLKRSQHCPQYQPVHRNLPGTAAAAQRRAFNAAAVVHSQTSVTSNASTPTFDRICIPRAQDVPFRGHLRQWQDKYGGPSEEVLSAFENHPAHGDVRNGMSRLSTSFNVDENTEQGRWNGEEDDDGEELITVGLFLKPGDVVELSQSNHEPVLAVFVQQIGAESQFFSVSGRWRHSSLSNIAFVIPGCIDPTLLQPLLPYLPTDPGRAEPKGEVHVPPQLGNPVQQILRQMTEEAERIYRANAPVLDSAYYSLADDHRMRMMTLNQIAQTLLSQNDSSWQPSPATLLAIRKSLNYNQFRFNSDRRNHRLTNVFAIRPKKDVEMVDAVHGWFREYQEYLAKSATGSHNVAYKTPKGVKYITDFIMKARRLISQSRKDREANDMTVGPSKSRLDDAGETSRISSELYEPFSGTDNQIIKFLQAWVLTDEYRGLTSYGSTAVGLILATKCYQQGSTINSGRSEELANIIDRATGYLFLQETGVITPFENRVIYDEQLMLQTIRSSRNIDLLHAKAANVQEKPDFKDSMANLRRDWGSTTIYCIDDHGAKEIDDGISIERVNGSTSDFWIHVHVANPTAFFSKSHVLSGLAAHMTESIYIPERFYPMLPTWVTHDHFSLQKDRPVLTISARINASGEMMDTRIQPGLARKIKTLTPSELSTILGEDTKQEVQVLVVGGKIPVNEDTRPLPELDANEMQDLHDLYAATKALWSRRKAAGAVYLPIDRASVRVFEDPQTPGLEYTGPSLSQARIVKGDPVIGITYQRPDAVMSLETDSRRVVEEMMILACQAAAAWCTERAIPVMYRGTIEAPRSDSTSAEAFRNRYLFPQYEKFGKIPPRLAYEYRLLSSRAIAHSAPLFHASLGVPSYVKVTSPLRRFGDMIAHWQIEAAIRYEARTGQKFHALKLRDNERQALPFDQRQIQEAIITLTPREKIIKTTEHGSLHFWATSAMLRAYHYNEAPLPKTFRYLVARMPGKNSRRLDVTYGILSDYGLTAQMVPGDEDIQLGDEWEVELYRINTWLGALLVKPIRLIHRDDIDLPKIT